jgi:hypothetical protein
LEERIVFEDFRMGDAGGEYILDIELYNIIDWLA